MRFYEPSVLIVDDDEDICTNVSDILNDMGYQTSTAPDGPSALKLARAQRYDVALLDYKMPGMNGLTLFQRMKQLQPDVSAFLVTAYTEGTVADEALQAGMLSVVRKPVDFDLMFQRIDDALRCHPEVLS